MPELSGSNIIMAFGNLELGGAERQGLLLARLLKERCQANVQIWGLSDGPGRVSALCDQYGISWKAVPFYWTENRYEMLKRLAKMAYTLRRSKPSILLPYTYYPNVVFGNIWKFTGAKACIWNQRDEGILLDKCKLNSNAVRQSSFIITNSSSSLAFMRDTYGVHSDRSALIHNGVLLAQPMRTRSDWRSSLNIGEGDFVAVMVANLSANKDHETLLKAWKIVLKKLEGAKGNVKLLLAGRFDENYPTLKLLADDLGLGSSLVFLGPVDDISGLLGAVDLGVLSSTSEGCPNGVLEYMASGLPVVGTDIPGIFDVLGHANREHLAPIGNDVVLADKILCFFGDVNLRKKCGLYNAEIITSDFSVETMCSKTVKIIKSFI